MALYLLNCSVDTSAIFQNNIPENLTFNEQESILELIIEKGLGFENAIPENDDCDSENNTTLKKTVTLDFFIVPIYTSITNVPYSKCISKSIGFGETKVPKACFEIHSPPPEV